MVQNRSTPIHALHAMSIIATTPHCVTVHVTVHARVHVLHVLHAIHARGLHVRAHAIQLNVLGHNGLTVNIHKSFPHVTGLVVRVITPNFFLFLKVFKYALDSFFEITFHGPGQWK